MKAENEDLKDEMLSKTIKDGQKEAGLSTNFTHQVMGKIEQLENSPANKPLVSWWAWLIIGGSFATALILALLNASWPEESEYAINIDIQSVYETYSSYILIAMLVMTFILADQYIKYKKKFSN